MRDLNTIRPRLCKLVRNVLIGLEFVLIPTEAAFLQTASSLDT